MMQKPSIGILGAGKLGIVLAQLFLKAGYTVHIAGSGDPEKIRLTVRVLAPGAQLEKKEAVAARADIVVLALPLGKYTNIPVDELKGKLVIDAMNYWWEVDGDRSHLKELRTSTSEMVQSHLPESRVIKAFSHIGYHDLHDETQPDASLPQKAIAIAGDHADDLSAVSTLVFDSGFEPLIIGTLADGIQLEPGSEVFGAHVNAQELRKILSRFNKNINLH